MAITKETEEQKAARIAELEAELEAKRREEEDALWAGFEVISELPKTSGGGSGAKGVSKYGFDKFPEPKRDADGKIIGYATKTFECADKALSSAKASYLKALKAQGVRSEDMPVFQINVVERSATEKNKAGEFVVTKCMLTRKK